MGCVLAASFGPVGFRADARQRKGASRLPRTFPPFELQASAAALDLLDGQIRGYLVERAGPYVGAVWLQGADKSVWLVLTDTRDLQFKFEVFTLAIESLEGLRARVASWIPPELPDDMPDAFRQLLSTRPVMPIAPARFEPWPLVEWRCDVVRRTEFIIDGVEVGSTIGNNPNVQSAARPGSAPPDASATCEVAAGLLFTDRDGGRLLAAVDWTPSNMIWTRAEAEIEKYVKDTMVVSLSDYRRNAKRII